MPKFTMAPSVVQDKFIRSTELENCLVGPRGEGKTDAGIMAMTYHATLQEPENRPTQWAILRDTWKNLERTTLRSFKNPSPKSFIAQIRPHLEFKDGGAQVNFPGTWSAFLFGMDSLSDLSKLQSMQLSGLWLEEPAPAAEEDIGAGMQEDSWLVGITSLRQSGTRRAQITMNYPDEDHWTWQRFHEKGIGKLFRIPRGENKFIDQDYRDNMAMALSARPDLMARLVEGRPYQVQVGEAVTPEYREDVHRSNQVLTPITGVETIRFWDGGLTPTSVFAQITPSGRFIIYDTLIGAGIGMHQLILSQVKPLMATRYKEITSWVDYGDEALKTPEQSDSEETAAKIINQLLGTRFQGGMQGWNARREAWKTLLMNRMPDHSPMFVLSKNDNIMHRALNGGWHYQKDHTGKVLRDKAVKDLHSHPGDAVSHGIAKIFKSMQPKGKNIYYPSTEYDVFKPNYGQTPNVYLEPQMAQFDVFGR